MVEEKINLQRREFVKSLPIYMLDRIQGVLNQAIISATCHSRESGNPIYQIGPPPTRGRQADDPKVARINVSRCLAWGNSLCQACYLACPLRDRALEIVDQKPVVNIAACDGCGFCIPACQMVNDQVAIELV